MSRSYRSEPVVEKNSDASVDNTSRKSEIDYYSNRNVNTGSKRSDMDKEVYQDPDSDRFLVLSERLFANAAGGLEMIAVSKCSMSLLPQKEAGRTDHQPFKQETEPLAKICCVKMEDDVHQPDELNSLLRVMKTFLKARYRLSD